jgi:hypothetical protein
MLSKEQRLYVDNFAFRNGMRNVCFISGLAREIGARSGYVLQTKNDNLKIPFVVDGNGTIPSWVREGEPVKIVGRLTGAILKGKEGDVEQHRVVVVKVLSFEHPSILEMPAQECWEMSVAKGAPTATVMPKGFGLPMSKSSNTVQIAGYVSGVMFRKPGVPGPDGKKKGGCLQVLIRQTKNPDEAVPVRIYGDKITKEYERTVRLGTPVVITQGDLRVDVKETGGEEVDGIAEVSKMPYIRSNGLFVATRDHIHSQPDWAIQLALQGREKKKPAAEAVAGAAQPAIESAQRPALSVATAGDGDALGDGDDLSVNPADIEAVMKQVGQLPKSPAVVG